MKTRALASFEISCLFGLLAVVLMGDISEAQPLPPPYPADPNAPATVVPATIVGRSANERIWARVSNVTNEQGDVSTVQSPAYTELATGVCRFSTESNAWIDADPTINIGANGASATGTAHSVTFSGYAVVSTGAVNLTTPDGKNLISSVYGLAYFDTVSGSNVLLGSLQSSQGVVVGDNELVYSNCFSGSVTADLEYFNKLTGLEQNVVLRTGLPTRILILV